MFLHKYGFSLKNSYIKRVNYESICKMGASTRANYLSAVALLTISEIKTIYHVKSDQE
jgi:hypothetical protein